MDIARCTLDNEVYQAVAFAAFPLLELSRKRRFLVCSECGMPAFFRKASRSGQAACFGARPHEDDCALATSDSERVDPGGGEDQDILVNPGQTIILDLDFGGAEVVNGNPTAAQTTSGRRGRFTGDGQRPDAAMRRRLSTILRSLIETEQFRTSQQTLEIPGIGAFAVSHFFVHFSQVNSAHEDQYRGYWGMVSDARFGHGDELWLNTGGRADMSICIPAEIVDDFQARFRITDEEDLAGAYVLVLGKMRTSMNGKEYVVPDDLGLITIR